MSQADATPDKMDYARAIEYWFGCINYEQRAPLPEDLRLEGMHRLLEALGDPHRQLRIVHVAGSKGKGSVSAMLAAILQKAGYRTGLFTSPHLIEPEERFQIDGVSIAPGELAELMGEIRSAVVSRQLQPTFFEIATALGFLYFQRGQVEVAVLEVGLGGRLDSTNVCLPEVAIITSISFDHMKQLGNTLESIAREKAGIFKPDRPALSGVTDPAVAAVIAEAARLRGTPLRELNVDFWYRYQRAQLLNPGTPGLPERRARVKVTTWKREWPWLELSLVGEHQAANAAVALAAVDTLREGGWQISEQAVAAGLTAVQWPSRIEILGRSPWTILDCAHNTASAQALVAALAEVFPPTRRVLVFASSSDKEVSAILGILAPYFAYACFTQYSINPRAVPPDQLAHWWKEHLGGDCSCHRIAGEALAEARRHVGPAELLCVTGSVFLAGELRPLLLNADLERETANS
jgi:dihydrofolate synthase/folylpolyglutamate synthase